jgi:hypothetical protein
MEPQYRYTISQLLAIADGKTAEAGALREFLARVLIVFGCIAHCLETVLPRNFQHLERNRAAIAHVATPLNTMV